MSAAAASEEPFKILHTAPSASARLTEKLNALLAQAAPERRIVVVCLGTDRCTGDALGPLAGTALAKLRSPAFDLYGTLELPVHARNIADTLDRIDRSAFNPFVIGVDACLGYAASVGCVKVGKGPIRPGAGVHKELPPVGDIHMTGIVNVGGFAEYMVLQNTRLHLVVRLAELMSWSLYRAISAHMQLVRSSIIAPTENGKSTPLSLHNHSRI